jgi:tRNA(Ile)-lysidine synthase
LRRLRARYRLQIHVAHLDHGARGAESEADAAFVAALAADWELPVTVERQDVPALARRHQLAFEEAARRARYAFLTRVALRCGAHKVAVGHNADDQAETVLMHFLRGTGVAGLRGMLPRTPMTDYRMLRPLLEERPPRDMWLIRPLLEIPRAEIEAYCDAHDLHPRFDRSNLDRTYFRNRLRHELLPTLETYNPNIRERLCHTAKVCAADYELLAQMRERAWADLLVAARDDALDFVLAGWRTLPVSLQRAILRRAVYRLRRSLRDVDFVHVENARQIGLEGETGAQATLPMGLAMTVGYDILTIGDAEDRGPVPDEPLLWDGAHLPVEVPGARPLPHSAWVLQAEMLESWDDAEIRSNRDPWVAYVDAAALSGTVVLRPRRPGERFCPQGMGGHSVKVSAFMINEKIPQVWRDHVPLLAAGECIVWVCGRRISQSAAVTPETRRVARLWFERDVPVDERI